MIENHKNGLICERCKNCPNLIKKINNKTKSTFIRIAVSSNTNCNSDCIYCYTHKDKTKYNSFKEIPTLEIFRKFYEKNLIDENTKIEFGGGEPTLHSDFDNVIKLILKNKFKEIIVYTSGIKYRQSISNILNTDKGNLVVSVDSGMKETYQKIKNVDKFDEVWKTLKLYANAQNKFPYQVKTKYIILENINDNNTEIDLFIEKTIEAGIKFIMLELEMNWYSQNKNNQDKIMSMIELVKYIKAKIQDKNIFIGYGAQFSCLFNDYPEISEFVSGVNK
jgi:molybdenum cofactor biosynthesis enzyme MoaA